MRIVGTIDTTNNTLGSAEIVKCHHILEWNVGIMITKRSVQRAQQMCLPSIYRQNGVVTESTTDVFTKHNRCIYQETDVFTKQNSCIYKETDMFTKHLPGGRLENCRNTLEKVRKGEKMLENVRKY